MIATVVGALGSAISGGKILADAGFFSHFGGWSFSFVLFFLMFCAMGIVWLNDWLNRRFQREAESRAGQYKLLTDRLTALENPRTDKS